MFVYKSDSFFSWVGVRQTSFLLIHGFYFVHVDWGLVFQ